MPATKKTAAKKTTPMTKAVAIERKETVEKRIMRLEGKLAKDRALFQRYADVITGSVDAEPAKEEAENV